MPRFFTNVFDDTNVYIKGDDAKHISKSLRMKIGERIDVCDLNGFDYVCEITAIEEDVIARVLEKIENESEPSCNITLFQALPKGDKMEMIIQKSVELGVNKIVPMISKRCVSRPDQKGFAKKLERYNKISLEAAKQSGRGVIAQVEALVDFNVALEMAQQNDKILFFYEKYGQKITACVDQNTKSVAIFVGSEGGFEEEEQQLAEKNGAITTSLGKRILRCETAPLCGICGVMLITDNF